MSMSNGCSGSRAGELSKQSCASSSLESLRLGKMKRVMLLMAQQFVESLRRLKWIGQEC